MNPANILSVDTIERDGIPIVQAFGEIDIYTAPEFEKALDAAIVQTDRKLIVDLSHLSYIDSVGLAALLQAHRRLSSQNKELIAVAVPRRSGVYRVLEISRFDQVFKVVSSIEEALGETGLPKAA